MVTEALQRLHDRYDRLKTDQHHYDTLQQQIQTMQTNHAAPGLPELQAELAQLQAQLAELEVTLESQLFSWDGFQDVFWMAVRFGGLGILIGWFLRGLAT
jgi:ABC-type phosphate transport system auxiliary subunit